MSAPELIQSGNVYTITNAKSGTVVDLSGRDQRSLIGFPLFNTTNQQWRLDWTNIGWTFQSVGSGLYIGIDGSNSDGTRLVAQSTPFGWDIWHDDVDPSTYRIYIHGTTLNWDLFGQGNPAPETPITLWFKWAGVHQTWKFALV
ncbi:hypothetical protein C0992_008475 [Termitomyces sp. T32_za158]|nr:hypothetical protein C0992_008475 [Termitomyces sp. T32_za158]